MEITNLLLAKSFSKSKMISKFGITEVANCNQFAFDKLPEPLKNFTFYHITDVKAAEGLYLNAQRSTIQHRTDFFVVVQCVGSVDNHISSRQKQISSEKFSSIRISNKRRNSSHRIGSKNKEIAERLNSGWLM